MGGSSSDLTVNDRKKFGDARRAMGVMIKYLNNIPYCDNLYYTNK